MTRSQSNDCSDTTGSTAPEYDLFNLPPAFAADSPAGKFHAFHSANSHVYDVIVEKAREWQAAGNGKLGMSLLFGMVRWVLALETEGDPYRINDHYVPFYSRLIMWQEPDLRGIFDLRSAPDADAYLEHVQAGAA